MGIKIELSEIELFNKYEFLKSIKHVFVYYPQPGWESTHKIGEGDYGQWFTTDEVLTRDDVILEDKVVINDLERKLLNKIIR